MDDPLESYKYQKKCALSRCKRVFGTNLKRQKYCKPFHRILHNELKRKKISALNKRIEKFERNLERIIADIDKAMKKAARETGRLAVLLRSIKGGENSTDTTKNKKVKARDRGGC